MPEARLQRTRDLYDENPARAGLRTLGQINATYDRAWVEHHEPKMRHTGHTEHSHKGNPGRKPIMRHG